LKFTPLELKVLDYSSIFYSRCTK